MWLLEGSFGGLHGKTRLTSRSSGAALSGDSAPLESGLAASDVLTGAESLCSPEPPATPGFHPPSYRQTS